MTEDQQHEAAIGIVKKHFKGLDQDHDDLYQEARYWLIRYLRLPSIDQSSPYFHSNVKSFLIRMLWSYMYKKVWYSETTGKNKHERLQSVDMEEIFGLESDLADKQLVCELIKSLAPLNQSIVKDYYFADLSLTEIGEKHELTKAQVNDRLASARKAMKRFDETGEKQPNRQQRVKCTKTGLLFDSIISAAKFFGIQRPTLHRYLTGKLPNKTGLVFV